ncbi:MAG: hypothetical protein IT285_11015 [Bdellovibrionales bacterium]|nr:hypothetical protein [Bdellovibrionales bacterium]
MVSNWLVTLLVLLLLLPPFVLPELILGPFVRWVEGKYGKDAWPKRYILALYALLAVCLGLLSLDEFVGPGTAAEVTILLGGVCLVALVAWPISYLLRKLAIPFSRKMSGNPKRMTEIANRITYWATLIGLLLLIAAYKARLFGSGSGILLIAQ